MSAETMLALLAAGIYLFDCVVLLECGQALVELRGGAAGSFSATAST